MENKKKKFQLNQFGQKFGLLIMIIIIVIIMTTVSPVFLTKKNIINVLRQVSINGIIAVGVSLVIFTGGIDLSVGSLIAVAGVVSGSLLYNGVGIIPAVILGVLMSTIFGIINGFLIAYGGLPPFIATLAALTIGRGFALVYSNGKPYTILNKSFLEIGKGSFLGIPIPIWILFIICTLAAIVINYTAFGRYVFAIGGNRDAAKLSGVNVKRVEMMTYAISGFLAGIAGIILAARISSGQPTAGEGYELDAIAAVAIGGTSMSGGTGSLSGTIMGFIILGLISNSLTLLNVSSFWQQIVKGIIIIVAVLLDMKARAKNR